MEVGFIGLGIMGLPMARNLLKAGYNLVVYDVVADRLDELGAEGAKKAASPAEVAKKSTIVITMLPNSPHVKEVVLGSKGVIEGVHSASIVVDMSSINPLVSQEVSEELAKRGVPMLDAPVSGGEPKAIEGTLAIMVGGEKSTFGAVLRVLEVMGGSVTHVGKIGSGNITKLANQIMVAGNIAAMSEALALATKAGVDPQNVYQAIRGGLAGSTVLDAKVPLILKRNFEPGFRIELHMKDLGNALELAQKLSLPVHITEQAQMIMTELYDQGKGQDDHGGMVQYYENKGNIQVRLK